MRLASLIASSNEGEDLKIEGNRDLEITGITADSREVKPGFLFVAIPGTAHDGRIFIPDAIEHGAVAILVPAESPSPSGGKGWDGGSTSTVIAVPDVRSTLSSIAAKFYPRQPETVAAVTGTSGKTSTAQFTREIWQTLGHRSASIGSLGFVTREEARYSPINTPDPLTLHRELEEAVDKKISHLVMEASSHGLAMHRMDHVRLKAAGFTNLSRDHLDYHETMENYLAAKQRLFANILPAGGTAVINADVEAFDMLAKTVKARGQKLISFGKQAKDLKLLGVDPHTEGQMIRCEIFGQKHEILLPVIGSFQAWNALCALGLVIGSGEDAARAAPALAKVSGVPGRLQLVGSTRTGASIFVDYAHKPDALDNVLQALRPHVEAHKGSKLGVVFGCGGNRDKGKRPLMGQIACHLADWVIVTDDNPRHEDPATIRREILGGCKTGSVTEIADRAQAIAAAIERLQKGDVLIIAGKGHEAGQIVGDEVLPFDDAEVARKVLGS